MHHFTEEQLMEDLARDIARDIDNGNRGAARKALRGYWDPAALVLEVLVFLTDDPGDYTLALSNLRRLLR